MDLNSSPIDLNGNFSFACLQFNATSDKPGGTPNHFRVYLLEQFRIQVGGHNSIRIYKCCRKQNLNFPCNGQ